MSYSHILIILGEQSLVPFIGTLLADWYDEKNDIAVKTDALLLLDLRMLGMNMLKLLSWAHDTYPNAPIALAVSDEPKYCSARYSAVCRSCVCAEGEKGKSPQVKENVKITVPVLWV